MNAFHGITARRLASVAHAMSCIDPDVILTMTDAQRRRMNKRLRSRSLPGWVDA